MTVPQGATALGSHLYLYRSPLPSTECIVAAHGGYRKENRMFKVPDGTTVSFFALHGESLRNARVDMIGI